MTILDIVSSFKGIGYGMVAVSWLIGLYYNIVICYAFYFFFASMTSKLPWSDCSGSWTDRKCKVWTHWVTRGFKHAYIFSEKLLQLIESCQISFAVKPLLPELPKTRSELPILSMCCRGAKITFEHNLTNSLLCFEN